MRCITQCSGALLCVLAIWPATGLAATRPNFLVILTDDQGYWDTGFSGNERIDTPVLDRLAAEGTVLDRFYAAPVCSPTRAGIYTGRYSLRTGLYNTRFGGDTLGRDEITLPQLLKNAGYRTGLFGKWHQGRYAGYQPQERGFDVFLGHSHGHIERYTHPDQLFYNGVPVRTRGYVTDLFTDAALNFLQEPSDQPFFCMVAYNAPHSPYLLDTSPEQLGRSDELIGKYLARGLPMHDARIYAMVERIDQNVGRLLDALQQRDLDQSTLVCFLSDNGGVSRGYSAGLRGLKASVYEGGVRVPFIARWIGSIPAGITLETQASHVDLLPTFCELAGAAVPVDRTIDGHSLVSLLTNGVEDNAHQPFVYHTWERHFPNADRRWAVSDGTWKLLCNAASDKGATPAHWQLYSLANDPGEQVNLREQHPEIVSRLRAEFLRWFSDVTQGQDYHPIPIPVGDPAQEVVEIQPSWATLHGDALEYVFSGYDWDTIGGWSHVGDRATWDLDVRTAGTYEVVVSSSCDHAPLQDAVRISIGPAGLDFTPPRTPTANVFLNDGIGTVTVNRGRTTLVVEVVCSSDAEQFRLNQIHLRPVNDDAGAEM